MLRRIFLAYFFYSAFSVSAQDPCFNLVIQEMSSSCEGMFDGELMAFTDAVNPEYLWLDADTNPLFPSQESQVAVNLQPGEFLLQITDENGCVELSDLHLMEPIDSTNVFIEHSQPFNIDPVSYNTWTECEVQITNLGCDGHFKPHYAIEHEQPINQGDFEVEYWRTLTSTWDPLYYNVVDGIASGYYGDELGEDLGAAGIQTRKIRVRFSQNNPTANLGEYTAYLTVFTADENGNVFDIVSNTDTLNVELVNLCETFSIDHISIDEASCANVSDASVLVSLSGGASPYSYSIDGGEVFQSEASFDSLASGQYALQLIDTNNCIIDSTISIGPPSLMLDTLLFTGVASSSLTLQWNTSPLVDGYRFRYRPVDSLSWITVGAGAWDDGVAELLDQKLIEALMADTEYEFQIKVNSLSDNCEEGWSDSYYINTLSMTLSATMMHTCTSAMDGSIEAVLEGGLPPYTIMWSGPNGFTADSLHINDLAVGDYQLYIADASVPAIVLDTTLIIEPLTSLSYTMGVVENVSCCGSCDGSIVFGMPLVSASSSLFLLNGDSVSTGDDEFLVTDLCSGDYTAQIVDSMACIWTEYLEVEEPICLGIDTVNFMSPNNAVIDPACYGESTGAIYVSGSGGVADYEFSINDAPYQNEPLGGMGNELFGDLPAGEYWVNIRDNNACSDSIYVVVDSAPPMVVNSLFLDTAFCYASCYDTVTGAMDLGAIYLDVSGGTLFPPAISLQYSLDGDSAIYQYGGTFESLLPGSYSINVKDDLNCVLELDVEVPGNALVYSSSITDVSCAGNSDGQFEITQLFNPNGTEQFYVNGTPLNGLMTDLAAGSYDLNVSYQYQTENSCWCSDTFMILEPMPITVSTNVQNPTCRESCDGNIQLNVQGGTSPYLYNWSNQEVTPSIDNLCGGFYSIQLQDSQGCSFFEQYSVIDPSTIYPILELSGDTIFVVEPTVEFPTAGTPPYTYEWLFNGEFLSMSVEPQLLPMLSGDYSVQVVDSNGCEGLSPKLNVELTSLFEQELLALKVYPNPTNGVFFLQLQEEQLYDVQLYDVYGRSVSFQYEQLSGSLWLLDLLAAEKGTYFVRLTTDKSAYLKAIVLNGN